MLFRSLVKSSPQTRHASELQELQHSKMHGGLQLGCRDLIGDSDTFMPHSGSFTANDLQKYGHEAGHDCQGTNMQT